ncbi:Branched-chain-amino-acid aminotransferase [Mycena venus]|uniref:Branched-chain-amino-acid aminotransferase n=1 Tax=Mycena venus TaxID=2733690 RepID=A0A8H6YS45_9AGAR|nr:Branched-chain-amino-acid aminotransferase [Mycena venus]
MASINPKTNGTNGVAPAPLDASCLKITRAETLKPVPTPGTYTFGDVKTDHMLIMTYHPKTGWSAPEIKPYGPIPIDPSSNCLQYATNVFEGMKAVLDPQGRPRMFRPQQNMQRLVTSAARMALPPFDADALLTCITKLVAIEARWIPALPDHSLYIRPTMIGTKPSIKVGASDQAVLYTIVTPVGPYFTAQSTPGVDASVRGGTTGAVSLLAVSSHVRSWPGGTGGFKLGLNYSPGFVPQQMAAGLGYDQVLWLLEINGETRVTEAGAMNFFAVRRDEEGVTIVTPPLDGTILPGITRDSAIVLLRAHASNPTQKILDIAPSPSLLQPTDMKIVVEERPLTLTELSTWAEEGKLVECFGTGTAVLVVGIERIGEVLTEAGVVTDEEAVADVVKDQAGGEGIEHVGVNGKGAGENENGKVEGKAAPKIRDITMSAGRGLGPVGRALWDKLLALKEGREEWGEPAWNVLCE